MSHLPADIDALEGAVYDWLVACTGVTEVHYTQQPLPYPSGTWISVLLLGVRAIGSDWLAYEDNPLVVPTKTVTAISTADNTLTITAHPYVTGDGPFVYDTTGAPIGGLTDGQLVWVIVVDADTIKLADKYVDAMSGVAVDFTSTGGGDHTLAANDDTMRAGQEVLEVSRGTRAAVFSIQCFAGRNPTTGLRAGNPQLVLNNLVSKSGLTANADILKAANIGLASIEAVQSTGGLLNSTFFEPRATVTCQLNLTSEVSALARFIERVSGENTTNGRAWGADAAVEP